MNNDYILAIERGVMKLTYKVVKDEPNLGLYFSITKNDTTSLDCLEDYLNIPAGAIKKTQYRKILKLTDGLNDGEMLLIEGA